MASLSTKKWTNPRLMYQKERPLQMRLLASARCKLGAMSQGEDPDEQVQKGKARSNAQREQSSVERLTSSSPNRMLAPSNTLYSGEHTYWW